eukprot:scaffold167142_cov63-Attheya_sp.AAC.3
MFLDDNELIGAIPTELGDMNYLSIFTAENNNLIGSIPSELARIEMLDTVLLSGNSLEGSIPDELCMRDIDMLRIDSTVMCGCCSKYSNENYTIDHENIFSDHFQ